MNYETTSLITSHPTDLPSTHSPSSLYVYTYTYFFGIIIIIIFTFQVTKQPIKQL